MQGILQLSTNKIRFKQNTLYVFESYVNITFKNKRIDLCEESKL